VRAPTGACMGRHLGGERHGSAASANPVMSHAIRSRQLPEHTSRTRADDDWYKIVLAADSRVDFQISGDGATTPPTSITRMDVPCGLDS